jgi:hypothetical protein
MKFEQQYVRCVRNVTSNMRWKWPPSASRQDWIRRAIFWKVLAITFANNKHSLLQSKTIHFPTILCELTIYTNTHEQQPYCAGTLSQMTEKSAERRVRQETGWLAGGPLLRVPTIRRTANTFLFISHTTNVLLFKSRCNIVIGVRITKELPGLVGSWTPCIWSVVLYGWETRTLGKNEERLANAFETWSWRWTLKIKWTDGITNDKVFKGRKKKDYC